MGHFPVGRPLADRSTRWRIAKPSSHPEARRGRRPYGGGAREHAALRGWPIDPKNRYSLTVGSTAALTNVCQVGKRSASPSSRCWTTSINSGSKKAASSIRSMAFWGS